MKTLDGFVENGIYVLKSSDTRESVFVCFSVNGGIGKIVEYRTEHPRSPNSIYENTGNTYFLNCYKIGDFKSLILNIDNYDIIGMIGQNYYLSEDEDKTYIIKGHRDDLEQG